MRITLESDYALRIITALALHNDVVGAKTLSDETYVTQRFTLKILHKLVIGRLVESFKGAKGGYKLSVPAQNITLKDVIELIDGPIAIARCLESRELCSMNRDKSMCAYHHIFETTSADVAVKLDGITINDVITKNYTLK